MIYPVNFLEQLDQLGHKTVYARIISLTKNERPVEQIEGHITGGSISLDGTSALRRSCQLSIAALKLSISDYYWTMNTKFKLAIGIKNTISNEYPEIIWFDQGIYVITQFSQSVSATAQTINISGQDKMCLLNGTLGGTLNSSIDFGQIEEEIKGVWRKRKLPIKEIVREMVHQYAGEPFYNIIVDDLDMKGLTLQQYRYDRPMYIWREINSDTFKQGTLDGNTQCYWNGTPIKLHELENKGFQFDLLNELREPAELSEIKFNSATEAQSWYLAKIDYGETAGYTESDLVYPSDLIANPGDSITSVLDKIRTFLGNFEYFYNIYGQFVFQKKQIQDNDFNNIAYKFLNNNFITTFNNSPDIKNIRNDFSVWGERPTGAPIHLRYAIDQKPFSYTRIEVSDSELEAYNAKYGTALKGQNLVTYVVNNTQDYVIDGSILYINIDADYDPINSSLSFFYADQPISQQDGVIKITLKDSDARELKIVKDWREIIYYMALDYQKYNHLDDFELRIIQANPGLYSNGLTGYEQYYTDMAGFWRDVYNPEYEIDNQELLSKQLIIYNLLQLDEKAEEQIVELNSIIQEIEAYTAVYQGYVQIGEKWWQEKEPPKEVPLWLQYDKVAENFGWSYAYLNDPANLIFWFDFLDTTGELGQFSVPMIGSRPKAKTDKNVKSIDYLTTPNIIFGASSGDNPGYRYFNVPDMDNMFSKSAQGKSAKEELYNLLYQHGYCSESITIAATPIYYLEPNSRIFVNDAKTGINGEYIISRIQLPLAYSGTMSITATRAQPQLL